MAWLPDALRFTPRQAAARYQLTEQALLLERVNRIGKVFVQQSLPLSELVTNNVALSPWQKTDESLPRLLKVPEQAMLSTSFQLPAAAGASLTQMMAFEIDRHTPFTAEQVYWCHHINEAERGDQQISVTLTVVPKQWVERQLQQLSEWSLPVTALCLETASGIQRIPLVPETVESSSRQILNIGLMALATVLFLVMLYQPVVHYADAEEVLRPQFLQLKKQAEQIRAIEKQNEAIATQLSFIDDRRSDYSARIVLLASLSSLLPEHTWLERSSIESDRLLIRGESAAASDLVALLMETEQFSDVRFSAPTTHNAQTGKDRFQIEAVLIAKSGEKHD